MFKEHTYAQSRVTGAIFDSLDESTCDAALAHIIQQHLLAAHGNELEYRSLDRYLVAFFLSATGHELLRAVHWRHFVLLDEHVFRAEHLVDIGRNIRQIILGDLDSETFTRLIFFSLPYLKHNRLTLPPLHETKFCELQNCVRIIHASCLGMLQPGSKKPPWSMRVQFHVFTHQLLVNATHQDLHVFCRNHLAILRISLIEYVIFFVRRNMHMENDIFEKMFSMHKTSALQFDEMLSLINTFRIQAYDERLLDTARLNEKAMITLERCNRMCTCKMNSVRVFSGTDVVVAARQFEHDSENLQFAFHLPKVGSRILLHLLQPDKSFKDVASVTEIQRSVSLHALPAPLYRRQLETLNAIYRTHSLKAIYTTRCTVCLLCGLKHDMLDDKMRIQDDGSIFCSGCNSCAHVITVNMLGVLLNVRGLTLFWCPCCSIVYKWLATGYDFSTCTYTRKASPAQHKECLLCKKRNSIDDVEVLESDLGFLCNLTLCYKHRPWDYQLKWVCDLESLKQALQKKRSAKPLY